MVFQPWRFEPPGKNSETEKGSKISHLLTADGDEWWVNWSPKCTVSFSITSASCLWAKSNLKSLVVICMYVRSLIKHAFIQSNCLLHFVVYIRSSNIFAHVYHSYHNSIGFELQPNVHYLSCAFESLQIQKRKLNSLSPLCYRFY